jgi:hypothetical protein
MAACSSARVPRLGDEPSVRYRATGKTRTASRLAAPGGSDDGGYLLGASDGGVFSFGDARFYGSLGGTALNKRIIGIATTPDGHGYWLVGADGGVFTFGDAKFYGSLGATGTTPITGIIADGNIGYRLITAQGDAVAFGTNPS